MDLGTEQFVKHMKVLRLAEATVTKRLELLARLGLFLGDTELLDATPQTLRDFQASLAHLAPASMHIYTRHITAFYRWAKRVGLIAQDPAEDLELPILRKALPHPTSFDDMRTIFACAKGRLRTAYVLAAFAGLRSGEICRLRSADITNDDKPVALIHGKGGKERKVPILPPVMDEIGYRRGWIVTTDDGRPVRPDRLSVESTRFLQGLGIDTTLHSMRAAFATAAVRLTHDPLLVRDLLGHESVKTTEIYMESTVEGAHEQLAGMTAIANGLFGTGRHLTVVRA